MAIVDYPGLVASVQKWAARSDSTFTNEVPNFIAFAEDRMFCGAGRREADPLYSPPLRNNTIETTGTISLAAGEGTLPTTLLALRSLTRSGDQVGLDYLPPERFKVRKAVGDAGNPGYFTIEDGALKVHPSYTGDLDITYWARPEALTSEAPTNAVLAAHPTVYLTAALIEAFAFMQDAEMAVGHAARLRAQIQGLNGTATSGRVSGATMRIVARNPIP